MNDMEFVLNNGYIVDILNVVFIFMDELFIFDNCRFRFD